MCAVVLCSRGVLPSGSRPDDIIGRLSRDFGFSPSGDKSEPPRSLSMSMGSTTSPIKTSSSIEGLGKAETKHNTQRRKSAANVFERSSVSMRGGPVKVCVFLIGFQCFFVMVNCHFT